MPNATHLSFLGVAKETTVGTPVAATAYIPYAPGSLVVADEIIQLPDKSVRGAMVDNYNEIYGPTYSTVEFGGPVFPDTVGYALQSVLSDLTVTGASAPFTHAFSTLNTNPGQPTTYTLSDYDAITTRQYAAWQASEVQFKFSGEGLLEYTVKGNGWASATTTKPTQSFTAITPIAAYLGTIQIGGVTNTAIVDATITVKRAISLIHSVDGTANPYRVWSGPVVVEGDLTMVMENETDLLTPFLTNTQPALDFNFQQGAGAALTQVKLHLSKTAIKTAVPERGKDYIELKATFEGLGNSTDVGASAGYGAIKATVQNAMPSGTFK